MVYVPASFLATYQKSEKCLRAKPKAFKESLDLKASTVDQNGSTSRC